MDGTLARMATLKNVYKMLLKELEGTILLRWGGYNGVGSCNVSQDRQRRVAVSEPSNSIKRGEFLD